MSPHAMLLTSFILFAITAFLGVSMVAIRESTGHNPPAWLTMFHGLPAAAGLTLFLYATFAFGVPGLAIASLRSCSWSLRVAVRSSISVTNNAVSCCQGG